MFRIWFSVFVKNTSRFLDLLLDVGFFFGGGGVRLLLIMLIKLTYYAMLTVFGTFAPRIKITLLIF